MSNMCYLWLQTFYMYFTPSLKIYHTFKYMYKFQFIYLFIYLFIIFPQ